MAIQGRERWANRPAFIMAAVGSAVGLGNLWRFPYIAFKNGGGAFFVPYFVALLTAGIPLMIIEYALGQKYQGGAPQALAAVTKRFRWVGWFALLVGTTITLYYVVVMAYAWHYSVASWKVAWNDPVPTYEVSEEDGEAHVTEVPARRVQVYVPAQDSGHKSREEAIQAARSPDQRLPVWTEDQIAARQAEQQGKPEGDRTVFVPLAQNVKSYYWQSCLGGFRPDYWLDAHTAGPESYTADMFRLSPNLVIGALVTWLAIFLIIFRGVRNVGKVVMVTVPVPVILLLVVLARGITLPGATEGLIYYLKPQWGLLRNPTVWIQAYGQIFFSLSLGFGILIAYASYMPRESDVTNSAFITSFGNCATSFIAGFAVFSVLGYLAYVQGQNVQDVAAAGPGLVFITYPIALSKMPMGMMAIGLLSFLFFLCLITLGIDSAFSIVEGVVTGFRDRFPRISRPTMTAIFCGLGFGGSLFFCTRSGLMWLDIVDNWMNNYGLPLVGLLECIAVGYFFHLDELKDYINEHSEIKVHNWLDAFIKVVTPAILVFLLASQFLKDIQAPYEGYDQILSHSVTLAGWGWFLFIICLALLLARSYVALGGVLATGVVFFALRAYLWGTSTTPWAELAAPAAMGAVAAVMLLGGLIVCIEIASRKHHMAGLSLEAREPTPPSEEDAEEAEAEERE
jgi:SNF family Na+-dependent transporter